jgi:hypothetical protein
VTDSSRLLDTTTQIPRNARTFFQRPDRVADPLYVVCPIFNAVRYRSRWKLYQDFEKRCAEAGALLYTVEAAFGNRDHSITDAENPRHVRVRVAHELWLKENLINIGISRLPADWKYVAWIDGDVQFARNDWANETIHALQHHPVVQMWTEGADLAPDHTTFRTFRSFAWCHRNSPAETFPKNYYYGEKKEAGVVTWHPGYAWAARREAIDHLGGLIDWAIVGSADRHMAAAFIGRAGETVQHANIGKTYRNLVLDWQARSDQYIKRDLGYVEGLVLHHWHGPKAGRSYDTRWKILDGYDPGKDLKRDWQGCFQLTDRSIELRDKLRQYFRLRNEDSIDL